MAADDRSVRAYVLSKIAIACLNSVFNLFYVDTFLSTHRLSDKYFFIGQSIYIVWNSINDPLFAYFLDRTASSAGATTGPNRCASPPANRKTRAVQFGGPLLAVAFLLPWYDVSGGAGSTPDGEWLVGAYFVFTLIAYDGLFTYVCLAHCALFADLSDSQTERVNILRAGEYGSLLVGIPVWISYTLYRTKASDGGAGAGAGAGGAQFRLFCVLLAAACGVAMYVGGAQMKPRATGTLTADESAAESDAIELVPTADAAAATTTNRSATRITASSDDAKQTRETSGGGGGGVASLRSILAAIFTHRSFWAFVAVNFVQILNTTVNANFFPLLEAGLTQPPPSTEVGATAGETGASDNSWFHGLVVACSEIGPPIIIVALSSPLNRYGTHAVIRALFVVKIVLSGLVFAFARSAFTAVRAARGVTSAALWYIPVLISIYLLLNRTVASATFGCFNLPLSDLIDDDYVHHARPQPLSAMYFGLNALITKPAQSIAPIGVVSLLSRAGYRQPPTSTATPTTATAGSSVSLEVRELLFLIATVVPVVSGVVQCVIWEFGYTLRGSVLHKLKDKLSSHPQRSNRGSDLCVSDENSV